MGAGAARSGGRFETDSGEGGFREIYRRILKVFRKTVRASKFSL
jgi:hypothetical protein